MKTKASIKSHSIHQMLIPFPIAFLTGSLAADISGIIFGNTALVTAGGYLIIAGIVMGLAAAIPGLIDYVYSVPPDSSGHKRATQHMLVNVSALIIFFISYILRGSPSENPQFIPLALQIAGAGVLTIGGWLGGTLVNRNFFGPDHRYAHAGKWKEETIKTKDTSIKAAAPDELKTDQMKLLKVNDERIVIAKTEEGYAAFQDKCTHRGGSLAAGVLICSTVQCLWHGSQFNVKTGEVKAGPAEKSLKIYTLEKRNDGYYLSGYGIK